MKKALHFHLHCNTAGTKICVGFYMNTEMLCSKLNTKCYLQTKKMPKKTITKYNKSFCFAFSL